MVLLYLLLIASNTYADQADRPIDQSCTDHGTTTPNRALSDTAKALSNTELPECKLPKIGGYSDYEIPSIRSSTGVKQRYRLKRTAENHFEVVFNLEFYQDNGKKRSPTDEALTKKWRNTAKDCLSKLEGKARGPGREIIDFSVYEGPQDIIAPPLSRIEMRKQDSALSNRAHAASWTDDLECYGVVHELLHLTGLVDEYPERAMGYIEDKKTGEWQFVEHGAEKTAYNCRKLYDHNTMMADDQLAWTSVQPHWNLRTDFCSCNQKEPDKCNAFYEKQKKLQADYMKNPPKSLESLKVEYPSECPQGFSKGKYEMEYPIPNEIKKKMDEGVSFGFVLPVGMTADELMKSPIAFTFTPVPASDINILESRHFNAIVFPGCLSKNWQYYQDALNAYRTSEEHGGEGCVDMSWSRK